MPDLMNVLVVGAGRMGSQIACEYALGGHHVTVMSRTLPAGQERIADAFETARQAGIADFDSAAKARSRVRVVDALPSVEATPDFVCESILEDATA